MLGHPAQRPQEDGQATGPEELFEVGADVGPSRSTGIDRCLAALGEMHLAHPEIPLGNLSGDIAEPLELGHALRRTLLGDAQQVGQFADGLRTR